MDESLIVPFLTAGDQEATTALAGLIRQELNDADGTKTVLKWQLEVETSAITLELEMPIGLIHGRMELVEARKAFGQLRSVFGVLLYNTLRDQLGTDAEPPMREALKRGIRAAENAASRRREFVRGNLVEPPMLDKIRTTLRRRYAVGLVGPSASGKSVLAAMLAQEHEQSGHQVAWADFGDPDTSVLGFVAALMRRRRAGASPMLVIIDDLHASPAIGALLLKAIVRPDTTNPLVLAIGWPDAYDIMESTLGTFRLVFADGKEICRRIIDELDATPEQAEQLLALTGANALVAKIAARLFAEQQAVPTQSQIAARAYTQVVGEVELHEDEMRGLWFVSCLTMFEIDTNLRYVDLATRSAIEAVLQARLLRQSGDYVSVGHRTFARLVVRHMRERRLVQAAVSESPIDLAVGYLRRAGDRQIRTTLDRLDLVALEGRSDGRAVGRDGIKDHRAGSAFLAQAWSSARILGKYLARQAEIDPTWGDNIGSAAFAAESSVQLGQMKQWRRVAEYVRERWTLDTADDLPIYVDHPTAEGADFANAAQQMRDQDDAEPGAFAMAADDVDLDRFHRTWALGVLLGFEASAMNPDPVRLTTLRDMARRSQLPDGSFYPSRVPWITARMCIGLASGGETVATSPVLRDAATWLRTAHPYGPNQQGFWRAGTGTWNSDVMCTAMTLMALGMMGVDASDPAVKAGLEFLLASRADWLQPGKEVDCAQSIEGVLMVGRRWWEYSHELRHLMHWARDSKPWVDAVGNPEAVPHNLTTTVPYVAKALISVTWETVKSELPVLLEGIAGVRDLPMRPTTDTSEAILDRAEAQLRSLAEFIVGQIRDRESVMTKNQYVEEVKREWERWHQRAVRCDKLLRTAESTHGSETHDELQALISEIDDFGRQVRGEFWVTLATESLPTRGGE